MFPVSFGGEGGCVGGLFIICNDDLKVLICLGKEVTEGCFDVFCCVVGRDNDADQA